MCKEDFEKTIYDLLLASDPNLELLFEKFSKPIEIKIDSSSNSNSVIKSFDLDINTKKLIKSHKIPPVFKNHFPNDYLLTSFGFSMIFAFNLFPSVFVAKINKLEMSVPNTLILLRDFFENPYFIDRSTIYYFDPTEHAQIMIYGSFADFVKIQRETI